jgi:flavin-dependent dehydrogenase
MARLETDVFIVGGGPAGLAAAIAAREKGFRVLVADCSRPPIEKPCGEGLMPDALTALRKLGITVPAEHSFPFRGIRFLGSGRSVDASFPSGCGRGVRRTILHQAMLDRATGAGVSFRWGARVGGIGQAGVTVDGQVVPCRWIVGADGQNSLVRRWAGLDRFRHHSRRFGFRAHYRVAPWTDCMELYWGVGYQIYVTPVSSGEVCAVVISRDRRLRFDQTLYMFPELVHRLNAGTAVSAERGAVTASCSLKDVIRGRVALIGDASGSVDAITGEGLCVSFQQAISLANALETGNLASYQLDHRRLLRRPEFMSRLMLSLDRFGWLREHALAALSAKPSVFSTLLAAHVGALSPAESLFKGILPLGWRMLVEPPTGNVLE